MTINIVRNITVILLIIVCIVKTAAIEDVPSKIRKIKKRQFVYEKLLALNEEHNSVFFFYKLIPSDYDNMIIEAKEKRIHLAKEEIDSFYKKLLKDL